MGSPYWSIACFIAVISVARLSSVVGRCDNVLFQIDVGNCLGQLYSATGVIQQMQRFDTDIIKRVCNESSVREIECARNVTRECREFGQDVSDAVDRYVDVDTLQNAADAICNPNSTAALDAARDCLSELQPRVKRCSDLARRKAGDYDRYELQCEAAEDLKQCFQPYINHCGRDVQPAFDAVALVYTPAVCPAYKIRDEMDNCMKGISQVIYGVFDNVVVRDYCYFGPANTLECLQHAANAGHGLSQAVREVYSKFFDINTINDSLKILCNYDNVAALIAAESCLNRYQSNVTSCIHEKRSPSVLSDIQSTKNEDDRYKAICDLAEEMIGCHALYGENCDRAIWPVLDAVTNLLLPPRCPRETSHQWGGSSAYSTRVSAGLLSVAVLFLVPTMNF